MAAVERKKAVVSSVISRGSFVSSSDISLITDQMGGRRFDPSGVVGVGKRCPWGVPQVLKCAPFRGWWPFPTTYWLSCPWLIKVAGALESQGGVSELEEYLSPHRSDWIKYQMLHGLVRIADIPKSQRSFLRNHRRSVWDVLRRGGIGGIDYSSFDDLSVKCLHLQIASWLALGHHPGSHWLVEKIPHRSCDDGRCVI
nr:DUF501 domain-containing protein [uncultured Dethiosulfovibrio sp.]